MPILRERIKAFGPGGRNLPGIYYYKTTGPDGKPAKTFYMVYKKEGRTVEEKAGHSYQGMTASKADRLRQNKVRGGKTNKECRQEALEAKRAQDAHWTMQRVFDAYMDAQGGHRSAAQDRSRWRKHLLPILAKKEPHEVHEFHVDKIKHLKKADGGGAYSKSTVKNNLELLRRLLNFARDRKLCPVSDIKIKIPNPDNIKTEFLTTSQIQRLMDALEQEPDIYLVALVKVALLTGMRRGELFKLTWKDLDFQRGFITIRAPKGGKTQEIPMNGAVAEILGDLPRGGGSSFVFPGRGGRQRQDVSRALRRVRRNADLPNNFRMLHGLRHTFASHLASSGEVDLHVLQRLLTHKSPAMTQRYAHLADEALHRASMVATTVLPSESAETPDLTVAGSAPADKKRRK